MATSTYTSPGTHQWQCPGGVTQVTVAAWGAGASGYPGGAGGGGGEYAYEAVVQVTPGRTYQLTVGSGGASSSSGSNPGGDTTFAGDDLAVTAHGATGSSGGAGSNNTTAYSGGAGAAGTPGTTTLTATFTSTGTHSWTVPGGVTSVEVEVWGSGAGGAGGGLAGGANSGGYGGGGGGYSRRNSYAVTPGEVLSVTVGTGGAGGAANSLGSNGNWSYVHDGSGATIASAHGGSAASTGVGAGASTSGTTGDVKYAGGSGGSATGSGGSGGGGSAGTGSSGHNGANNSGSGSASGGSAVTGGGAGGSGGSANNNGSGGSAPGGGGGGGGGGSSAGKGGGGAHGQVKITYTVPTVTGGGGGSSAGTGAAGNPGSGQTGGSAPAGGGAGGGGGAPTPAAGSAGATPGGGGGGGGFYGATAVAGGAGGNGQLQLTYSVDNQPAVPLFLAGYGPQPSDFDAWIQTPLQFLTSKIVFRAALTAAQNVNANTWTTIQFDTVLEDPYAGWQPASYSWMCPAGMTGWYEVTVTAGTGSSGIGGSRVSPAVGRNGVQLQELAGAWNRSVATIASGSWPVSLYAGQDTVCGIVYIAASSGSGVLDTTAGQQCEMQIVWISS